MLQIQENRISTILEICCGNSWNSSEMPDREELTVAPSWVWYQYSRMVLRMQQVRHWERDCDHHFPSVLHSFEGLMWLLLICKKKYIFVVHHSRRGQMMDEAGGIGAWLC